MATSATLVLLSYTKLLHTIILSFSIAALKYPDNSIQLVWLPDATVKYFSGKYIVLFIMAVIIVIAGVAYILSFSFSDSGFSSIKINVCSSGLVTED